MARSFATRCMAGDAAIEGPGDGSPPEPEARILHPPGEVAARHEGAARCATHDLPTNLTMHSNLATGPLLLAAALLSPAANA